jgi:hypothetical protein
MRRTKVDAAKYPVEPISTQRSALNETSITNALYRFLQSLHVRVDQGIVGAKYDDKPVTSPTPMQKISM